MFDCNFLASFLSMYCKNALLFKKVINKVIIIQTSLRCWRSCEKAEIRWGEFYFWRHVEQIQKEVKNWREGGGEGTRMTACPQTSIFE